MQEITAEYLKKSADNVSKVYEAGINDGKKAEYDASWDAWQQNGNRTDYRLFWHYTNFVHINPKHQVRASNAESLMANSGLIETVNWEKFDLTAPKTLFNAFSYCTNLKNIDTDLGVSLTTEDSFTSLCRGCQNLERIQKITAHIAAAWDTTFYNCINLKHINIDGIIGRTFDIKSSPLTAASAKSILTHLKNYSGTDSEFAYSVLFHADVWALLDAEGNTAPHGGSWKEYVDSLCWNR